MTSDEAASAARDAFERFAHAVPLDLRVVGRVVNVEASGAELDIGGPFRAQVATLTAFSDRELANGVLVVIHGIDHARLRLVAQRADGQDVDARGGSELWAPAPGAPLARPYVPRFDARALIGLSEADAVIVAHGFGCSVRAASRDGKGLRLRRSLNERRINIDVVAGNVSGVRQIS